MGARFAYNFWSDFGDFAAFSTATGYDPDTVKDQLVATKWRSDDGYAGTGGDAGKFINFIRVDLGDPREITHFSVVGHDFSSSDELTLIGSDVAGGSGNPVEFELTYNEGRIAEFITPTTRQHWLLEFKMTTNSHREIGRMVLGDYVDLERSALSQGFTIGNTTTMSRRVVTEGGQMFSDMGSVSKRCAGVVTGISDSEKSEMETMTYNRSTALSLFAYFDIENGLYNRSIYGNFDNLPQMPGSALPRQWDFSFSMTEQL